MAKQSSGWGEVLAAVAVLASLAGLGLGGIAAQPGKFKPLQGGALVLTGVLVAGIVFCLWFIVGKVTPLYSVPALPEGKSWLRRIRARPTQRRDDAARTERLRKDSIAKLRGRLRWNETILSLAAAEGRVWPDYDHGPSLRNVDYRRVLLGASKADEAYLARCQDADHQLRKALSLSDLPGYGEPLSEQDRNLVNDALEAIGEARQSEPGVSD